MLYCWCSNVSTKAVRKTHIIFILSILPSHILRLLYFHGTFHSCHSSPDHQMPPDFPHLSQSSDPYPSHLPPPLPAHLFLTHSRPDRHLPAHLPLIPLITPLCTYTCPLTIVLYQIISVSVPLGFNHLTLIPILLPVPANLILYIWLSSCSAVTDFSSAWYLLPVSGLPGIDLLQVLPWFLPLGPFSCGLDWNQQMWI